MRVRHKYTHTTIHPPKQKKLRNPNYVLNLSLSEKTFFSVKKKKATSQTHSSNHKSKNQKPKTMSSSESASPKSNLKFPIDLPVVLTESKIQELQEQNMTELTDGVLPDRVEVNDYIRFFCNNYRDQKLVDHKCSILSIEKDRTACYVTYYRGDIYNPNNGDDNRSWRLNLARPTDRIKIYIQGEKKQSTNLSLEVQHRLMFLYAADYMKKKYEVTAQELCSLKIGNVFTYLYVSGDKPEISSIKSYTVKIEDILLEEGCFLVLLEKYNQKYRLFYDNEKYSFFVNSD
jgi:hypothetical protein